MPLRLRPFSLHDETEATRAQAELADDDMAFLLFREGSSSWADYLGVLDDIRRGVRLPDAMVPATLLAAEVEGRLVGRTSIRHDLNDWLGRVGGHVGYAVRPADRRRGHATEILRQSVIVARALGVDRVLVTCDDDNVASATTIERCGGVLQDVVPGDGPHGGPGLKRRHWIDERRRPTPRARPGSGAVITFPRVGRVCAPGLGDRSRRRCVRASRGGGAVRRR